MDLISSNLILSGPTIYPNSICYRFPFVQIYPISSYKFIALYSCIWLAMAQLYQNAIDLRFYRIEQLNWQAFGASILRIGHLSSYKFIALYSCIWLAMAQLYQNAISEHSSVICCPFQYYVLALQIFISILRIGKHSELQYYVLAI